MTLNRREVLKGGAAGFLLGFLFRGRDGKLSEEPQIVEQPPSAITIRAVPQHAFRPSRLVIKGTVVGKQLVPETKIVLCPTCGGRRAEVNFYDENDTDDDLTDEELCEECDGFGDKIVQTGRLVERDVMIVPWSIESLTIGARSQFADGGTIPGDLFSTEAVDTSMSLDAAREGQEIEIVVRYTGDKPDGEVFYGALIGTSIDGNGVPRQTALPISSTKKVVA